MRIEADIDLEGIIKATLEKALNADLIAVAIEARVTRLVKDTIDEQTSSYSDFGQLIRSEIKAAFPSSYSMDNQSNFRDAILKIVAKNINAYQDTQLENKLNDLMEKLLTRAPERIKLSEVIQQAVKMWEASEPSIHIVTSVGVVSGYVNVYLDKEPRKDKYSCSCSIGISDKGSVYSIKLHGQDIKNSLFVGPYYEFERFLFWMYTGSTVVEVDITDPEDLDLPEREYRDSDED